MLKRQRTESVDTDTDVSAHTSAASPHSSPYPHPGSVVADPRDKKHRFDKHTCGLSAEEKQAQGLPPASPYSGDERDPDPRRRAVWEALIGNGDSREQHGGGQRRSMDAGEDEDDADDGEEERIEQAADSDYERDAPFGQRFASPTPAAQAKSPLTEDDALKQEEDRHNTALDKLEEKREKLQREMKEVEREIVREKKLNQKNRRLIKSGK